MWWTYVLYFIAFLSRFSEGFSGKHYCQPGEECWPTLEEIHEFQNKLSPTDDACYGLPTFSSKDEPGNISRHK